MKKFLAVVLCLCTLTALTLCISAAVSPTVECVLSDNEITVGETITVTVVLKNCPRVKTMGITPVYDESVFELVSGEWLLSDTLIADFNKTTGDGVMAYTEDKDCNGNIFSFKLMAKSVPIFGDVTISATAIPQNSDYNGSISNQSVKSPVKVKAVAQQTDKTPTEETTPVAPPATTPKPAPDTPPEPTPDTTVPIQTDVTSIIDTIDATTVTEPVSTPDTTGNTTPSTSPEDTNEAVLGDDITAESDKTVWIIVVSVIAVMAIGTFVYMRIKANNKMK